MRSEGLSSNQVTAWSTQDQPREMDGQSGPAEAPFQNREAGDDWSVSIVPPIQLIPRVYPGL